MHQPPASVMGSRRSSLKKQRTVPQTGEKEIKEESIDQFFLDFNSDRSLLNQGAKLIANAKQYRHINSKLINSGDSLQMGVK